MSPPADPDDASDPDDEADGPPTDPAGVRRTFDRIADHFAKTRHSPWPEVREFLDAAPPGAVGLDLGCGNGRHAELLARRVERTLCADASRELLGIARERLGTGTDPAGGNGGANDPAHGSAAVDYLQVDAAAIPLRSGSVDLALYVATLHHLPGRGRRIRSLDELARVLAAGGRALVSAWATTHDRFDRESGFDTTVDWTLPDGETVPRFYHVYDPGEFDRDLAESDLSVRESWESSGNCYAVVGSGSDP